MLSQPSTFASNAFAGFANGLFVSLFFYVEFRESQAAATLHKAEVERPLLSKQAIVTAYDEYAVSAFEERAVDHVLKPVTSSG